MTVARRRVSRDFFRSTVPLWRTPPLVALSRAEMMDFRAVDASSFLPALTVARYFFSRVFKRDFTLVLRLCLRSLLRARRSADFVFGIQ